MRSPGVEPAAGEMRFGYEAENVDPTDDGENDSEEAEAADEKEDDENDAVEPEEKAEPVFDRASFDARFAGALGGGGGRVYMFDIAYADDLGSSIKLGRGEVDCCRMSR